MRAILLIVFGATVLLLLAAKEALDMAARIEYAEGAFPSLKRWAENKKWHRILLISTLLFYGGTLYELLKEPSPFIPPIPNLGVPSIAAVVKENKDLTARLTELTKPAPANSLRHRTIELVNDLTLFWVSRPTPPQQAVPSPMTDDDRARNEKWDSYWKELKAAYQRKEFNERILGIVKEYQTKGVPVGYLDKAAEQPDRLIGALPYGGFSPDTCDQYMTELCLLRELAFHVDAYDARVDSSTF